MAHAKYAEPGSQQLRAFYVQKKRKKRKAEGGVSPPIPPAPSGNGPLGFNTLSTNTLGA